MIIPNTQTRFIPSPKMCIGIIFCFGVIASIALLLAALLAVSYLLNLTLAVIGEVAAHIAALYASSDNVVKLLMLCLVAYAAVKIGRPVLRSLR